MSLQQLALTDATNTSEIFQPLTETCSCYLYTHIRLELDKNRVEEPVQVHTPFVIEHHSSIYTDEIMSIVMYFLYMLTINCCRFLAISRP